MKNHILGNVKWGFHCILDLLFLLNFAFRTDIYRVFSVQAEWTLTHANHEDAEQSTVKASMTLVGVTLTDSLMR
jgi:hypothetical protein